VGCRERRPNSRYKERVLGSLAVIEQLKALSCLSNFEAQSCVLLDVAALSNARALSRTRLGIIRASTVQPYQTLEPGVRRALSYVRFCLLLPIFQSPNALVKYQSQNPLHTQPPASVQTTQLLFPSQIHLFRASFKSHLHGQGPAPGNTCLTTLLAYSSFDIAPICECVNLP